MTRFLVSWTCPRARDERDAVIQAKRAVGERLASRGKIVGITNILTHAEPHPSESRPVTHYTVLVDVQASVTLHRLAKIFDAWKVVQLGSLKPALAGVETA